jgi:hypothetical protein
MSVDHRWAQVAASAAGTCSPSELCRRRWLSSSFGSLITTPAWASDQTLLLLRHWSPIRLVHDST